MKSPLPRYYHICVRSSEVQGLGAMPHLRTRLRKMASMLSPVDERSDAYAADPQGAKDGYKL